MVQQVEDLMLSPLQHGFEPSPALGTSVCLVGAAKKKKRS